MKRLAVIGFPIEHSISPAIHQPALDALGIAARYERRRVAPEELPTFVEGLRGGGWMGVNVTVPHKEAVIPFLDGLDPEAEAIGAVNTVVVMDGGLVGYNTDARGFIQALQIEGRFHPPGATVALLGAGGAARAVLRALTMAGVAEVRLFNRHLDRAKRLVDASDGWGGETLVAAHPWEHGEMERGIAGCDLLVNATSVGLAGSESPISGDLIPADALVVDLIYNPRPTRLLQEARERGARTLDGLPMLVYQAAAAFQLWTGRAAPVETMMRAAEAALL
jgi:shikimate dehydrogenase